MRFQIHFHRCCRCWPLVLEAVVRGLQSVQLVRVIRLLLVSLLVPLLRLNFLVVRLALQLALPLVLP